MNIHNKHIITYVTSIIFQSYLLIHASATCNRSCGTTKRIPFPFGFSSDCTIPLRCAPNGTIHVGEFPVHKMEIDNIVVDLPPQCGRPLKTLHQLFTKNFAPTSRNGILLQNCTALVAGCVIPTTTVQTHLENDCDNNNNNNISAKNSKDTINCYSEQNISSTFVDYGSVERTGCKSLISAISMETYSNSSAVSLDVGVVQLGWWLEGGCQCSSHATCTKIVSPNGKDGYRCKCVNGFSGDGFRDGDGCRKESGCNASRYLSGHCGGTTRVAVLIGGVVAGALLMVSVGLICFYFRRHSKSNTGKGQNRKPFEAKNINIPVYPYKEIEKATQSFSEKRRLGTGAYATVYSGKLDNDNQWVAIKRIKHRADDDNIELVMNEIKLLSSVSHPNLVRLLGCSIENGEQILIYEYMPNGTLCQHLHRDRGNGLPWPVRLTVASETAKAIAYLHSDIHPPIYHRDIKCSNILLDYDYKAKVADFGLSRLGMTSMTESSHISTAPQGTPGYLDPQYHQNFHLSDRSDVYSFGVVLVEIITALKVVDFTRGQNEVNLASLAVDRIGKGRLVEIIDPFIMQSLDDSTFSSLQKVAELAFRCLAFHSEMRPSMKEVANELEQIRLTNCASVDESSTNLSNIPPTVMAKKPELMSKGTFASVSSVDCEKNYSPVSVQETWLSDRSSPSSNSLLRNSIH